MRALLVSAMLVVAFGLMAFLALPEPACAGNCGIKPIKPIPPIGCTDLVGVCVCDAQGQNCHWQWQCVE